MRKSSGAGSGVRSGSVGDAMEAAEVAASESLAKNAREPADYALWQKVGLDAVKLARGMSALQRAQFVVMLEERMKLAAHECRSGNNRLQHALDLK